MKKALLYTLALSLFTVSAMADVRNNYKCEIYLATELGSLSTIIEIKANQSKVITQDLGINNNLSVLELLTYDSNTKKPIITLPKTQDAPTLAFTVEESSGKYAADNELSFEASFFPSTTAAIEASNGNWDGPVLSLNVIGVKGKGLYSKSKIQDDNKLYYSTTIHCFLFN